MKFYVYGHYDQDGVLKYVGKGSGYRATDFKKRSNAWRTLFSEITPQVRIFSFFETEELAYDAEELLIQMSSDVVNCKHHKSQYKEVSLKDIFEYFIYDEKSPSFLKLKTSNENVGAKYNNRYTVYFKGKYYQANRIVWMITNKLEIPKGFVIDHIDGNSLNNNKENLRCINKIDNGHNTIRKSKSGEKYISPTYWNEKLLGYRLSWTSLKTGDKNQLYFKFSQYENPLLSAKEKRDSLIRSGEIYWNERFERK